MKSNPVGWFEIYVQDVPRARRFYEAVFEISLRELKAPFPGAELWAFPMERTAYGSSGALMKMPGVGSGGNTTVVYFQCEDCAVEESRVASAGGRVQRPKFSIGEYGYISLAVDTEGNTFGLHSMR